MMRGATQEQCFPQTPPRCGGGGSAPCVVPVAAWHSASQSHTIRQLSHSWRADIAPQKSHILLIASI